MTPLQHLSLLVPLNFILNALYCYWNSYKQDEVDCELRTPESEKLNWEKVKNGAQPKDCGGIQHEPRWEMLQNIKDGSLTFCPPQLHIFMGETNAAQKKLTQMLTPKQATEMYEAFLKPAGIGQAPYFAGTYEGNQCQAIVQNRHRLRALVQSWGQKGRKCLPICDVYDALARVNNICYKKKVNLTDSEILEARRAIKQLKKVWKAAKLSVTVKSHVLFEHGGDWIEKYRCTLTVASEQDGESTHRLYDLMMQFYHSRLSRSLCFSRYNAERFLPLPPKKTRAKRKHVEPSSTSAPTNSAENTTSLDDAIDHIQACVMDRSDDQAQIDDLNKSTHNLTIDESENGDSDDDVCHIGERLEGDFVEESDGDDEGAELVFDDVEFIEL